MPSFMVTSNGSEFSLYQPVQLFLTLVSRLSAPNASFAKRFGEDSLLRMRVDKQIAKAALEASCQIISDEVEARRLLESIQRNLDIRWSKKEVGGGARDSDVSMHSSTL